MSGVYRRPFRLPPRTAWIGSAGTTTVPGDFTADAVIKANSGTKTFSANAIIKKTWQPYSAHVLADSPIAFWPLNERQGNISRASSRKAGFTADHHGNPTPDISPAEPYEQIVVADSPVGYWRLGEASGTSVSARIGSAGTLYEDGDGYTWGTSPAIVRDPNTSLTLPGNDGGYIVVPHSAALNLGDTFSLEMWVKRSATGTKAVISKGVPSTSGWNVEFSSTHYLRLWESATGQAVITVAYVWSDLDVWHHVVFTKNGSTRHAYLDGVDYTGSDSDYTFTNDGAELAIGATATNHVDRFPGSLDEVAVYNYALTAQQVLSHYHTGIGKSLFGPSSYNFNANNYQGMRVQDFAAASIGTTGILTVEFWARVSDITSEESHYVIGKSINVGSGAYEWEIGTYEYPSHEFSFNSNIRAPDGTSLGYSDSVSGLPDKTWHHVVCSWNQTANTQTFYVNGVKTHTTSYATGSTTNGLGHLAFGERGDWDDTAEWAFFNGNLAGIALYDKALSDADVARHLSSGATWFSADAVIKATVSATSAPFPDVVVGDDPVTYYRMGANDVRGLWACGGECTLASHWTTVSGSVTKDTGTVYRGSNSIKIVADTGGGDYVRKDAVRGGGYGAVSRFRIRFSSLPSANAALFSWKSSTTHNAYLAYDYATGKLCVAGETWADRVLGPVISADTWYLIDFAPYFNNGSESPTIQWRVDGNAQTSFTGSYTGGSYYGASFGQSDTYLVGYANYTMFVDDYKHAEDFVYTQYPLTDDQFPTEEASDSAGYDEMGVLDLRYRSTVEIANGLVFPFTDKANRLYNTDTDEYAWDFLDSWGQTGMPAGSSTGVAIAGWVYPERLTYGENYYIGSWGNQSATINFAALALAPYSSTWPLRIYYGWSDGTAYRDAYAEQTDGDLGIRKNHRYHVVVSHDYSAETVKFYLNGALIQTVDVSAYATPSAIPASAGVRVGGYSGNDLHNFHGILDEVAFFDHVLTDQQVLDQYTAGQLTAITLDAWIYGAKTGAFTADAVIFKAGITPATQPTADAVILRNSGTKTFSADAVILRNSGTKTFSADAVVKKTITGASQTFTANAVVFRNSGTKTFTADAVVEKTISPTGFTANAVLKKTISGTPQTFTADAVIKKTQATGKTWTADAIVKRTMPVAGASFTANAVIKRTFSGAQQTFTADAILKKTQTTGKTWTADAVVLRNSGTKTFSADAVILRSSGTKTFAADAVIFRTISGSFTANAFILGWFTADALIYGPKLGDFVADAIVWKSISGSFSADAVVKANSGTKTFSADAVVLRNSGTKTLTADSVIFANSGTKTFSANAVVKKAISGSYTADAVLFKSFSWTFAANAVVKAAQPGTFTADAVIFRVQAGSLTADAVARKTLEGSVPTLAVLHRTSTAYLATDAIVHREQSGSLTGDAVLTKAEAGSFTADAIVWRTQESAFAADAVVFAVGSDSITADAVKVSVGRCVWTTPGNYVQIDAQATLAFLMPAAWVGKVHFEIQLDLADTFDTVDLVVVKSHWDQTGWEVWDGDSWEPIPAAGLPSDYAGSEARYTIQTPLDNGTWYRRVRAGVS